MTVDVLAPAEGTELIGTARQRHLGPRPANVAERAVDALGWVVGVATVYGPVSVCATFTTMGLIALGRFAGHRLLTAIVG